MWDAQQPVPNDEKRRLRGDAAYIGIMLLATESLFLALGEVFGFAVSKLALDKTAYLLFYAATYALGMAVPAIVVSLIMRRRHFPLSPAARTNAVDAFFGILASIGACMVANIVSGVIVSMFEAAGVDEPQFPDYLEPTLSSLLLNVFVFAVLPALLEEMLFRGYVLRALRPYGDWLAVAVSALLFGLMHGNVAQIPFATVVGVALGWLYVMTDNIWLAVAVHFINNAFSYVMQYCSFGMDDATRGMYTTFGIFSLTVIGMVAFGVLLARRSALLRRLPRKSSLSLGRRVGMLASTPLFIICVTVYLVMTVLGSM